MNGKSSRKRPGLIIIIVVVAAAVFALSGCADAGEAAPSMEPLPFDNGKFNKGVSVLGVDLSGQERKDAEALVQGELDRRRAEIRSGFTADGEVYEIESAGLGIRDNLGEALDEAYSYGRTGSDEQRRMDIGFAERNGVDFDVEFSYDKATIEMSVRNYISKVNREGGELEVAVEKTYDPEPGSTSAKVEIIGGTEGRYINAPLVADSIIAALNKGDYEPVEAVFDTTRPEMTREDFEAMYGVIGEYTTKFKDSGSNRVYNIGRMSDIINGQRIEPGQTWSMNDLAGPRTSATGWRDAPGITNGELVDQPGGGICQVSTTLYNAVIRAELEVVDKTNHSFPLGYAPGGLDATISTGAPDFKFRNNKEYPVYILANCDGSGRTISVSIYGPRHGDGLRRGFSSEEVSTFSGEGDTQVDDPNMPVGETRKEGGKMGRVFQVYKHWYDADDNEVKAEPYEKVTYQYIPGTVYVGTKEETVEEQPAENTEQPQEVEQPQDGGDTETAE